MKLPLLLAAWVTSVACHAATYVDLPGGSFTSILPQGASPPASAAVDVQPFALRATPVTVGEFAAFVRKHPEWMRGAAPAVFADARYLLQWTSPLVPGID